MNYKKPIVVNFTKGGSLSVGIDPELSIPERDINTPMLNVPMKANFNAFKSSLSKLVSENQGKFDYVVVKFDDVQNVDAFSYRSGDIKLKHLTKQFKPNIPVVNKIDPVSFDAETNSIVSGNWYVLNSKYEDGKVYYASNTDVLERRDDVIKQLRPTLPDTYTDAEVWGHHQATIWEKFKTIMPIYDGKLSYLPNHKAMLQAPDRGLNDESVNEMFSWRKGMPVAPGLIGDELLGMPSFASKKHKNLEFFVGDVPLNAKVMSIQTAGMNGPAIPMKNANGEMVKFRVAADISNYNIAIKPSMSTGETISKNNIYDKDMVTYWDENGIFIGDDVKGKEKRVGMYKFKDPEGYLMCLTVKHADPKTNQVTFEDVVGEFNVRVKDDIRDVLVNRGYDFSNEFQNVGSLKVVPSSKYIWPSGGMLAGDADTRSTLSTPSRAGFIVAKEPTDGSDEYVVVVAEGALKGMITAQYMSTPDATGLSLARRIAKDRGVIVAQIPGVSQAFVDSVTSIYSKKNVVCVYVAMDADGRDNLDVCRGIHYAHERLRYGCAPEYVRELPEHVVSGLEIKTISKTNLKAIYEKNDIPWDPNLDTYYENVDNLQPISLSILGDAFEKIKISDLPKYVVDRIPKEDLLGKGPAVSVLSWDPAQKGIDDALLAVAQGRITISDMGLRFGSAEELFPIDGAEKRVARNLDGSPVYGESWDKEYERQKHAQQVNRTQQESAAALDDAFTTVETAATVSDDVAAQLAELNQTSTASDLIPKAPITFTSVDQGPVFDDVDGFAASVTELSNQQQL